MKTKTFEKKINTKVVDFARKESMQKWNENRFNQINPRTIEIVHLSCCGSPEARLPSGIPSFLLFDSAIAVWGFRFWGGTSHIDNECFCFCWVICVQVCITVVYCLFILLLMMLLLLVCLFVVVVNGGSILICLLFVCLFIVMVVLTSKKKR